MADKFSAVLAPPDTQDIEHSPPPVADPDIQIRGAHEMRLNAKGTVGSFGARILIYNKIITRKI